MVASNFAASLKAVRQSEGGNDDDPADHGGRTSRGITQSEYNQWRVHHGQQPRDVWSASDDEIDSIYFTEYWKPYCDLMPKGLDYLYFDMKVNAGPYRATLLLQRALGVSADGYIGPITLKALAEADAEALINKYSDAKRAFYYACNQPRFIRGWLNRVVEVQQIALEMIGKGKD